MGQSTYGFKDLSVVMAHPALGQIEINGAGARSITFTMSNDSSHHDLAADGSVMTSKIAAPNGTVTVVVQQTSEVHHWFRKLYNYLSAAPLNEWAQITLLATGPHMQVTHEGNNMSFQKRADMPYQAQGGEISWTFLAGELIER